MLYLVEMQRLINKMTKFKFIQHDGEEMKISEFKNGMSTLSTEGKIISISEPRSVNTRYGQRSVADARLQDDTGVIKMSLWEDNIDMVNVGDEITVSGAYISEFRDELQLNIPRSGKIEVKKKGDSNIDILDL